MSPVLLADLTHHVVTHHVVGAVGHLSTAEAPPGSPDGPIRKVAALAGYVAFGIMAMTISWGVLTTTGFARRWVDRQTMIAGHMVLAIIFLTFGWVHGMVYIFQTQEQFGIAKVFVPFIQGGEIEVALGIVGLELATAVAISLMIQRRLSYRTWHFVHWLAYPAFAFSLAHTITTSPEVRALGLVGITVAAISLVVIALAVLRVLPGAPVTHARIAPVEP